jgi:hypothetical protein
MKVSRYIFLNIIFFALCYFGVIEGVVGAGYVFWFIFWMMVVGSLIASCSPQTVKKIKEKGPTVPRWIDISLNMIIVAIVVWHGHYIAGAFFVIQVCLLENIYKGEKLDE